MLVTADVKKDLVKVLVEEGFSTVHAEAVIWAASEQEGKVAQAWAVTTLERAIMRAYDKFQGKDAI